MKPEDIAYLRKAAEDFQKPYDGEDDYMEAYLDGVGTRLARLLEEVCPAPQIMLRVATPEEVRTNSDLGEAKSEVYSAERKADEARKRANEAKARAERTCSFYVRLDPPVGLRAAEILRGMGANAEYYADKKLLELRTIDRHAEAWKRARNEAVEQAKSELEEGK